VEPARTLVVAEEQEVEVVAVVAQEAVGYTHKTVLALAYTWAQARQGVTQPQQPNHQLILTLGPSPRRYPKTRRNLLWG